MSKLVFVLVLIVILLISYVVSPFLVASFEKDKIEESELTNIDEIKHSEFICKNSDLIIYHQAEKHTNRISKTIYIKGNVTNIGNSTIYLLKFNAKFYDNDKAIVDLGNVESLSIIYLKPEETVDFNLKHEIYFGNWNYPKFSKIEKYKITIST